MLFSCFPATEECPGPGAADGGVHGGGQRLGSRAGGGPARVSGGWIGSRRRYVIAVFPFLVSFEVLCRIEW